MPDKQAEYEAELNKWTELFKETDESTQKAAAGLIQKAAYLHSLCWELEKVINQSGAIKVHPDDPELQKQVPAVKEYARLVDSYGNVVNKLNILRTRFVVEGDEGELKEFEG